MGSEQAIRPVKRRKHASFENMFYFLSQLIIIIKNIPFLIAYISNGSIFYKISILAFLNIS